jgi:hypothetical protein
MADPAAVDVPADPTRNELAKLPFGRGTIPRTHFHLYNGLTGL